MAEPPNVAGPEKTFPLSPSLYGPGDRQVDSLTPGQRIAG